MNDTAIHYLPATELLRRFRNKDLSPVDVVQALIDRADAVEPVVNALSHRFFESALQQAKKAETRYARGKRTRKLEGLPLAIKDETFVQGMPCTAGSLALKDQVADFTSIENSRILRAGAIVHARTTTPEFSCAGYTHSKLWGVTRNPWNPAFTPGGSSGGAAAALASGTTPLASGSDIAGSIRIPAGASGVVGYKPPYGRNAAEPPFNLDTYCHTGPLARNVADLILLQNVVSGPHPEDVASLKPKLVLAEKYEPIKDWKIAFSIDLGRYEVDPEVRANTLAALDVFRDLGASVEEVDIDWPEDMIEAGFAHLCQIFGVYIKHYYEEYPHLLTDYARDFAERSRHIDAEKFYRSIEVAGEMFARFGPILERYDCFVCPTNAIGAVAAEHDQSKDPVSINGKPVDPMLGWFMTLPFNMMSRCPVISIPSGQTRERVPTGIQIVGATYCDRDVFRAAMAYETAFGEWYRDDAHRPRIKP